MPSAALRARINNAIQIQPVASPVYRTEKKKNRLRGGPLGIRELSMIPSKGKGQGRLVVQAASGLPKMSPVRYCRFDESQFTNSYVVKCWIFGR